MSTKPNKWPYLWYKDGVIWGIIVFIMLLVLVMWLSYPTDQMVARRTPTGDWVCNDIACIKVE